ncbi:hypothetical protein FQR65_LT21003 [Abscondita terminalis]|nr:hypothetical protein FQR65_LT21003 [Abscondita terminalis]
MPETLRRETLPAGVTHALGRPRACRKLGRGRRRRARMTVEAPEEAGDGPGAEHYEGDRGNALARQTASFTEFAEPLWRASDAGIVGVRKDRPLAKRPQSRLARALRRPATCRWFIRRCITPFMDQRKQGPSAPWPRQRHHVPRGPQPREIHESSAASRAPITSQGRARPHQRLHVAGRSRALSAQATDAGGVKRATRASAMPDTPQKMLRVGEEDVREAVRTMRLYRTRAEERDRALREARSRNSDGETAMSCSTYAFGAITHAVDTMSFRIANRLRIQERA